MCLGLPTFSWSIIWIGAISSWTTIMFTQTEERPHHFHVEGRRATSSSYYFFWLMPNECEYSKQSYSTPHLFKHFSSTLLCYYNYNRESIKAVFGTFFKTTWLNHFCQSCCMQKNFLSVVALFKLVSWPIYLPSCQKRPLVWNADYKSGSTAPLPIYFQFVIMFWAYRSL